MEQTERIRRMEQRLDRSAAAVMALSAALDRYEEVQEDISELEAYYAKHVPESIRKNGDTRIVVYCKSNKKGKTTKIERVRIYNTNLSDSQTKDIEQLIYRFFMKKVRWKPDETRMQSDWMTIYYKIEGDQGIIP